MLGIVSQQAVLFADDIFNYEKRIVNHLDVVKSSSGERRLNEIKTLAEMKTIAPSVKILDFYLLFLYFKINYICLFFYFSNVASYHGNTASLISSYENQ